MTVNETPPDPLTPTEPGASVTRATDGGFERGYLVAAATALVGAVLISVLIPRAQR